MWPDDGGRRPHLLNVRLMRATGLDRLLSAADAPGRRAVRAAMCAAYACLLLGFAGCAASAVYARADVGRLTTHLVQAIATALSASKVRLLLRHSAALGAAVPCASVDFLPWAGHRRDRGPADRAAAASVAFAAGWTATVVTFVLAPVAYACASRHAGPRRYNVFNLTYPGVTDRAYDGHYAAFYAAEAAVVACCGYAMTACDCLLFGLTAGVAYQLNTVASSYGRLGRDRRSTAGTGRIPLTRAARTRY